MDLNLDLARLKGYIHSLKQCKHNPAINLRSPFFSLVRRQYHYRHCQHDQWSASWLSSAHLPTLRHCSKLDWNWECSRLSRNRQLSQPAITTFLSILQEEEEGNQTNLRKRRAGLGKEEFLCQLLRNKTVNSSLPSQLVPPPFISSKDLFFKSFDEKLNKKQQDFSFR